MARGGGRRLPADVSFPAVATDWRSGQSYSEPDVIFAEGKWWNRWHYNRWRKNLIREQERVRRNKAIRQYLRSQPADPGL